MTGNAQKTHFARAINKFAEDKVLDALQLTGKALPCHVTAVSGSIVTVRFDITGSFTLPDVTCPMFGPEYIRYPVQVNDKGVVLSADYYIGGISGLGGGVADLTVRSNLSTLIWFPISSNAWSETDDPNSVVIYGPEGAIIRPTDASFEVLVTKTGITIKNQAGTHELIVDATNVRTVGDFQGGPAGHQIIADATSVRSTGPLKAGNGATGGWTAGGKTVVVEDGIVTSITP